MRKVERILYYCLYLAIIICGLYYCNGARYWLINDSLSYLSIARLYADGHFWTAINSYWSPIFSWLLATIKFCGLDELYWGRMILVAGIIPTIIVIRKLGEELLLEKPLIFLLAVATSIILFQSCIANFTPDVLYIPCLLYILLQHIRLIKNQSSFSPNLTGLIAALGFLTKQYTLFFFTGITVAIIFFFLFTKRRKEIAVIASKSFAVFITAILPWVILISIKTGYFTFSTTTEYQLSQYCNPAVRPLDFLHHGLLPLPYPEAYSYWDTPFNLPFEKISVTNFIKPDQGQFHVSRINNNAFILFDFTDFILEKHLILITLSIVMAILFQAIRRNKYYIYYLFCLLAILIYSSGYILLVADYRYTYFLLVMALLLTAMVLNDLIKSTSASFWIYILPVTFIMYELSARSIEKTNEFYTVGMEKRQWFVWITRIQENDVNFCHYETEEQQCALMYENNFKDFGMLKAAQPLAYKMVELKKFNIRYILSAVPIEDSLKNFLTPAGKSSEGIQIYEVN